MLEGQEPGGQDGLEGGVWIWAVPVEEQEADGCMSCVKLKDHVMIMCGLSADSGPA